MRLDKVKGQDVCRFICGDSYCGDRCCMHKVIGRCYSIADAWNHSQEQREELLRIMRWRIDHGERTAEEASKIGVYFDAKVV